METSIKWKSAYGYTTFSNPNKVNTLTVHASNICLWHDGTIRPGRYHTGNCEWFYDGQFFYHLPIKRKEQL